MRVSAHRKGQAAMEFLMTYGWAILVVLIVIGALGYFGVLNPSIMLPEKCTLQLGLNCKNHILRITPSASPAMLDPNSTIFLELENGMGKGIIITSFNVTGGSLSCGVTTSAAPVGSIWNDGFTSKNGWRLQQGRTRILALYNVTPDAEWADCKLSPTLAKTKADVEIRWYFEDASDIFTHTMRGEILANVEDLT